MSGVEFKPMGIGDILDAALRLYRSRFVTFLIIALIVYVPYSLLVGVMVYAQSIGGPGGPTPAAAILPMLVLFVFFVIAFPLCQGAMVHCISATYLGDEMGATDSYRRAAPRVPALIGTNIMVGIVVFLGFLLLIVPGVIFSLWYMLATIVVVLESLSGSNAMSRSKDLMSGNLGKGFLLMLVLGLLSVLFTYAMQFLVGMVPWPNMYLAVFCTTLAEALLLPFTTAVPILLYYDLRIRKEAFDLERLATMIEGEAEPIEPAAPEA